MDARISRSAGEVEAAFCLLVACHVRFWLQSLLVSLEVVVGRLLCTALCHGRLL